MMKPQPCYSIRAHSISRGILMSFKGALPINSLKPGTKQQGWEEWASPPLLMDWATTPTCQNQSKGLPSTAQTMAIGLDRVSWWQNAMAPPTLKGGGGGVKDASLSLQNRSHKALKWSISSWRAPGPRWGHSSGKTGDGPPVRLAHTRERAVAFWRTTPSPLINAAAVKYSACTSFLCKPKGRKRKRTTTKKSR